MIRPFRLQDARLVSQLQSNGTHLDLRRALLWPRSSLSTAISAYIPFSPRSVQTLVMKETVGEVCAAGFVQYRERRERHEADIIFCAPALETAKDEQLTQTIWSKLTSHLIARVGERGVQRVYARLPDGARALDLFWQLGFSAYARERVYRRKAIPTFNEPLKDALWRPQRSRDIWNVGQLYSTVTPKLIQQAENLPQSNSTTPYRDSFGGVIDRRFVWNDKDEVRASLRLIRGDGSCWLKVMVHPHCLERADDLMQDAMRLVPPRTQRLYASVREYQSELEGAILRTGFSWLVTEVLMVKHTTVMIKKPVLKQLPVMERIGARPTTPHMTK